MLRKMLKAICEQIGSVINQTLTDQEKKQIKQSPLNKTPIWKEKQRHHRKQYSKP